MQEQQQDNVDIYSEEIQSLHKKAMNLAEEGFFLMRDNKIEESKSKFYSAFVLEKTVANIFISSKKEPSTIEPSRSVICNSAAQLAIDAGYFYLAKQYAEKVIEYNWSSDLVDDANEILKKIPTNQ